MFEQEAKMPAPAAATGSTKGTSSDIVIHTMPKEFYGKEAALLESGQPKPEVKPTPVQVVPPPPPPVMPPPAKPVIIRKRSWRGIVITIIIALLVLGIGGYGAYRLVTVAAEQQAAAEAEVKRLEKEAADKTAAEEEARKKAAAEAAAAEPSPAKDTDSDGLTDVEELLYNTNFRDPDSDEDSFLDGNEVFHRYHPLGVAPSTLLDTGAVKVYEDALHAFSIYYPSTWNDTTTDSTVTFKSSRQASIQITWTDKSESLALTDWLEQQGESVDTTDLKEVLTKEGFYGYTSQDDRTAYLNVGVAVVTLVYDLGGKTQVEYLQTFQMMVNSFTLVATMVEEAAEDASITP